MKRYAELTRITSVRSKDKKLYDNKMAGYDLVKKEFEKTLRTITQLGYGLVIIAHSTTRLEQGSDGNSVEILAPDIPKRCYDIVNRMVDIIGYIGIDSTSGDRYLYTRKTPTIMAGSRFSYLSPKIKLGYTELVNALSDAIDEDARNGGIVVDKIDKAPLIEEPEMDFKTVYNEIGKIAKQLKTLDDAGGEDAHYFNDCRKIIENYLGMGRSIKNCTENQIDQLTLILQDLQKYVKDHDIKVS